MNPLKTAAAVVALLISLGTGLYGIDNVYLRQSTFVSYTVQQMEDEAFRLQQRIWDYQDRMKEKPGLRHELEQRIRELELKKKQIEERIRRGG